MVRKYGTVRSMHVRGVLAEITLAKYERRPPAEPHCQNI